MNILVTGANGQLGREIRNASIGSGNRYVFTDVQTSQELETVSLDITNADAVRIIAESEHIDVIVNCAAYTDVEKAEDDYMLADLLNHKAVASLSAIARDTGAVLIHISTDYVFSGDSSMPYTEESVPSPSGVYGATKLSGERAVTDSGCRYIIVRTSWLYSPYGKNFVKTMLKLTSGKDLVKVVYDQVGTPTYASDLAGFIVSAIEKGQLTNTGIYNYSNEGVLSWYDFAVAISSLAGHRAEVVPCSTSDYPSKTRRPHFSVLDKSLVKNTFGITIPYWRDSLVRCLERINSEL